MGFVRGEDWLRESNVVRIDWRLTPSASNRLIPSITLTFHPDKQPRLLLLFSSSSSTLLFVHH